MGVIVVAIEDAVDEIGNIVDETVANLCDAVLLAVFQESGCCRATVNPEKPEGRNAAELYTESSCLEILGEVYVSRY